VANVASGRTFSAALYGLFLRDRTPHQSANRSQSEFVICRGAKQNFFPEDFVLNVKTQFTTAAEHVLALYVAGRTSTAKAALSSIIVRKSAQVSTWDQWTHL